jgi:hypothetical protein
MLDEEMLHTERLGEHLAVHEEIRGEHDEVRGSAPVMSTKDLLLEVYRDMKFVRPALEGLLAAGLVARVEELERDKLARESAGVERRRIGDLSTRTLAAVVLVSNCLVGLAVVVMNALNLTATH